MGTCTSYLLHINSNPTSTVSPIKARLAKAPSYRLKCAVTQLCAIGHFNYKDVKERVFTQFMNLTGLFSIYSQ